MKCFIPAVGTGLAALVIPIFAIATEAVVTPAVPEAYQPFSIEFSTLNTEVDNARDVIVYIDNDSINIEYQAVAWDGGPFGGDWLSVEVQGLPTGEYTLNISRRTSDGVTEDPLSPVVISIEETAPTLPVYALYNWDMSRYFITAFEGESNHLVSNKGWYFADKGFNVWPADGPAPETAQPICRFFSSLVNSHFYVANGPGCEELKDPVSGWLYEGIAFQALLPMAGACPSGTDPVWRLYNNRHESRNSNHRFVASHETYRSMIANGWVGEGVAFCSPPTE